MAIDTTQNAAQENKPNDKEYNFRALETKFQRELEKERQERERLAKELEEARQKFHQNTNSNDDIEDESEPYVDTRRLNKKLAKFEEKSKRETKSEIDTAVSRALYEERKRTFLEKNPDFIDTIQKNAEKLMQTHPELTETILELPDGFERQKLVYKNIKALGLDKPEIKQPSMQEKIDSNRRNMFYQPTNAATPPFTPQGDCSPEGQKRSYEKMKELQRSLRLG